MATPSFAAGFRIARGLLAGGEVVPQEGLVPSHVVVALGLSFSELT
jgi:hypothetical protein